MDRPVLHQWVEGVLVLLSLGFACGCQFGGHREEPPLANPQANFAVRQFAGTPLSGELTQSIDDVAAQQAWGVAVRVIAVKQLPVAGFGGIGPLARLVLSDDSSDLMAPSSRLVYSTSFRTLEPGTSLDSMLGDAKSWTEISTSRGAVAPGTALSIGISQPVVAAQTKRLQVNIGMFRLPNKDGYQLAISSLDRVVVRTPRSTTNPDPGTPPAAPIAQPMKDVNETVIVPQPAPAGQSRIVLALPMDFAGSEATGLVIDLAIDTKPSDAGEVARNLKTEVDASAARAAARSTHAAATSDDLAITAMFDSLATAGSAPRAALVYLAQHLNARLAESVALVADDKVLALIAKSVRDKWVASSTRDRATMAWMVDRATIQVVASIKDDDNSHSLAAVQGALETYAGEAGRHLDLLQSLANASNSSEDLDHRLIAEHLNDLEDNSLAMRVRAFDWLTSRHAAPADFDPMASAKKRRATLERFHDAATTQP